MRTEALYLTDAYLRAFPATVLAVADHDVILDRTAFHPAGGGQPDDLGRLEGSDGASVPIVRLGLEGGDIVHTVAADSTPPSEGAPVRAEIDWARRYAFMRAHTMLHVLSGVVFRRFGSGITGGQIYEGRARMDFGLEQFGRPLAEEIVASVNEVVGRRLPVTVRFVAREEFAARPELVRVATALPPDVEQIRLIDIEGFDVQADGGTHVRSTAEVGTVRLEKLENKGARNKRLYIGLDPVPAPGPM